jgi:hypothetical protein
VVHLSLHYYRLVYFFVFVLSFHFSIAQTSASRDSLINSLGVPAIAGYVGPLTQNFGDAYNMGWISQIPSKKSIDLHAKFSVVAGLSYVVAGQKNFDLQTSIQLDRVFASDVADNIDFSNIPEGFLRDHAREKLITTLVAKTGGFKVEMKGPTVLGSSQEEVHLILPQDQVNVNLLKLDSSKLLNTLLSSNQDTLLKYTQFYNDNPDSIPTLAYDTTISWETQTIPTGVTGILQDLIDGIPDALAASPGVTPQISIGSIYGTQFAFRMTPDIRIPKFGKIGYYGWSIQHDLFHFLSDSTWSALFQYSTQEIKFSNIMRVDASQAGLTLAKNWKPLKMLKLTPYFGWSFDQSTFDLNLGAAFDLYKKIAEIETDGKPSKLDRNRQIQHKAPWELQNKIGIIVHIFNTFDIQAEYKSGASNTIMASLGLNL